MQRSGLILLMLTLEWSIGATNRKTETKICKTEYGDVGLGTNLNLPKCIQLTCESVNGTLTLTEHDCSTVPKRQPVPCTSVRKRRNSYPHCCQICDKTKNNFELKTSRRSKMAQRVKYDDVKRSRRNSNPKESVTKVNKPIFVLPLRSRFRKTTDKIDAPKARPLIMKNRNNSKTNSTKETASTTTIQPKPIRRRPRIELKKLSSLLAGRIQPTTPPGKANLKEPEKPNEEEKNISEITEGRKNKPSEPLRRRNRFFRPRKNHTLPTFRSYRHRKNVIISRRRTHETTKTPLKLQNSSTTTESSKTHKPRLQKNASETLKRRISARKRRLTIPSTTTSKPQDPLKKVSSGPNDQSADNNPDSDFPSVPHGFRRRQNYISKRVYSDKDIPVQEISVGHNTEYFSSSNTQDPKQKVIEDTKNSMEDNEISDDTKPKQKTNKEDVLAKKNGTSPNNNNGIFSSQMDFQNFDRYFSEMVANHKLPFDMDISSTNHDDSFYNDDLFAKHEKMFDDVPVTVKSVSLVQSRKSFSASENREVKARGADRPLYKSQIVYKHDKFPGNLENPWE